jgi:hypothetical protein
MRATNRGSEHGVGWNGPTEAHRPGHEVLLLKDTENEKVASWPVRYNSAQVGDLTFGTGERFPRQIHSSSFSVAAVFW